MPSVPHPTPLPARFSGYANSPVVQPIYKDQVEAYFKHYNIAITWKVVKGGELNKTMDVS
jgi:hypothetical protein